MTREEAIAALKELQLSWDTEGAHAEADDVLCSLLSYAAVLSGLFRRVGPVRKDQQVVRMTPSDQSMVERVAMAITEELGRQRISPTFGRNLEGINPPLDVAAIARAAISAMREPTEAQYDALSATDKMWRELDSKTVWQTYIDAALGEQK